MSRIIAFNFSSDSLGEFSALASRGWQIAGVERTNGGGNMALTLPKSKASQSFMRLGYTILIEHPHLPAYAGMIDLPWSASPPYTATVYNAEYLLTLRYPDAPVVLSGTVAEIATQMINMTNTQEDLYLRPGDMSQAQSIRRDFALDQRNMWDQLNELCSSSGMEMIFRAARNPVDRKLYIYIDMGVSLGYYTDALLRDGEGGNMIVQEASIDGKVINRVIATASQANSESRLTTAPIIDPASRDQYRLRGEVIQFREVDQQSVLDAAALAYLGSVKRPVLKMNILISDRDNGRTFSLLRLGNSYRVHAARLILPGGVRGWFGIGRTLAMAYNETDNTVGMTVEGYLG